MQLIDDLYYSARDYVVNDDLDNAGKCLEQIKNLIQSDITSSRRYSLVRNIENICGTNKDLFILDYGCGGAQTVLYLHLLGYTNVYGIDIASQNINNKMLKILGVMEDRCLQYDGVTMAFEERKFDFVFSEQVLEHVHNIEAYYKEASRVMKPGAMAIFSFPHRLMPYDSHGRTWFIHMLPGIWLFSSTGHWVEMLNILTRN